jgi:NAD(P)H-dependent FMN reductase
MSVPVAPSNPTRPVKVGIILGSTRPIRKAEAVGRWVLDIAKKRPDAEFELVDLREYPLPFLDEPHRSPPPASAPDPEAAWAEKIGALDAFIFVTPEYNHSTSAVLKNAIDQLHGEWYNKVAGFVSYGSSGGVRAVEHLRLILAELQVATVRSQAWFSTFDDFANRTVFQPRAAKEASVNAMLDQLLAWGRALNGVRGR